MPKSHAASLQNNIYKKESEAQWRRRRQGWRFKKIFSSLNCHLTVFMCANRSVMAILFSPLEDELFDSCHFYESIIFC